MAKRSADTTGTDETIVRGTDNVFADLGCPDADERQTKLHLAHAINDVLSRQRLTRAAAAAKLGVRQPKVSALANDKLEGFSVEPLMTFLTALDQDVDIVIRRKPRPGNRCRDGQPLRQTRSPIFPLITAATGPNMTNYMVRSAT